MKKYLLILCITLAVILAFPIAVSAGNTVTVTGQIGNTFSLSVDNATLNFPSLQTGENPLPDPTTLTITTSSESWNVDTTSTNGGYMNAGGAKNLQTPFELSLDGSTWNTDTGSWAMISSTTPGITVQPVYMRQNVLTNDAEGSYSITVTFTGSSS
jgi:hypothetical protein